MKPGSDAWSAVGFTAGVKADEDSATRARGFHAEHLLILLEETPGIPREIITAFQDTSVAPHNLIVAFGNPDHALDPLSQFAAMEGVADVRISAFDHPNLVLKNPNFIPGATSTVGVGKLLKRYRSDTHPLFLSRARGITPTESRDALIRLEWCYAVRDAARQFQNAEGEYEVERIDGLEALGVDVSRSEDGDDATIAHGRGPVLLSVEADKCDDVVQLGAKVARFADEREIPSNFIAVDVVGVGGGTVDALKERDREVVGIVGGSKPVDDGNSETKFVNLRSQIWWALREDIREKRIFLPDDAELFADLVAPKWGEKSDRLIYVESKDEIKKRLGRSPDRGDAVAYWNWIRSGRDVEAAAVTEGVSGQAAKETREAERIARRLNRRPVAAVGRDDERGPYHAPRRRTF